MSSSAVCSSGAAENGFAAATLVNGANSAPMAAEYLSRLPRRPAARSPATHIGPAVRPCAAAAPSQAVQAVSAVGKLPAIRSEKSGRPASLAWRRIVDIASARPARRQLRASAMTPANSLTRCCGDWPPVTSRTARRGAAPAHHPPEEFRRPAERHPPGPGTILELAGAATVSIAASPPRLRRCPPPPSGRPPPPDRRRAALIFRLSEPLGGLPHADHHRRARVEAGGTVRRTHGC